MMVNGMQRTTYMIPERETKRYAQHGMAKISFNALRPVPYGNGQLALEPLMKIARPVEAWVQRGETPAIIISSGTQKTTRGIKDLKSHVIFDKEREIEPVLRFSFSPKSHTERSNDVGLEPIYKEMPKETGELAGAAVK
jgi:hypothetical protein